jgi:pimeloyl-ACP methyl ester carboxylesterase
MNASHAVKHHGSLDNPRDRLLAGMPVTERRLELAGVSTAVLEGGSGPAIVLLHGPGEYGAKWMRVIPDLIATHRVIAPDLPGHGASEVVGDALDVNRVLAWLRQLIESTCSSPPVLVGQILGGAIAARIASAYGDIVDRLVLVDALGLSPFQPTPEFGLALSEFLAQPSDLTHDRLWRRCAFDLEEMRQRMGHSWQRIKAYNLDRALTQSLQAAQHMLMEQFGLPAIAPATLAKIALPTALLWGRHDLATPLSVAEAASACYGWPLYIIEKAGDDPPLEQPEAFLSALRSALGSSNN